MQYTSEQKYGFITSLIIHSLVFIIFFTFSVYKKPNDIKTYYIEFAQFNEQIPIQTSKSSKPKSQDLLEKTITNEEIKEPEPIKEIPPKEMEPIKPEVKTEPVPEPVKEIEKPKIIEPIENRIVEEKPILKDNQAKTHEAVVRNPSFENENSVKVASKPVSAPKPQIIPAALNQTVIQAQPMNKNNSVTMTASTPSTIQAAGKPSLIETEFGKSGAPVFLHRQMPVYPMMARKLGKEGKVVLRLHINEKGKLLNIEVVEPAGYGFTESAIEAVKMSTFAPAYDKGTSIESKALLTIRFVIKKS